jgi:hypothetical protein
MKENWKDIPGHEGSYQASDQGRIRSLDRVVLRTHRWGGHKEEWHYKGKVLSARAKGCGHLNVSLGAANTQLVHRLVLLTFVGPPDNGRECLHINGIPSDNRLENLRWGSRHENRADMRAHAKQYARRQGSTHLTEDAIRQIKIKLAAKEQQKLLAVEFGVHVNTINNINRGYTHKWVAA